MKIHNIATSLITLLKNCYDGGYWRECFAGFGEKTRDLEIHHALLQFG